MREKGKKESERQNRGENIKEEEEPGSKRSRSKALM